MLEEASAAGERERWLAAAGWAVHGRATTGDGRDIACDVLTGLSRWGTSVLDLPAARRLRVELAMVAAGAGEVGSARQLVAPVAVDDGEPELLADLRCVHARCAVEDTPADVTDAIGAAVAAWQAVGGPAGEIGGASVALIEAVVERRAGRPAAAVERAKDGLARLERGRAGAGTPSGHLGAALAAEWLSALLDADRAAEALDGCAALLPRLSEWSRPTRQLALLRLTVARVLAAQDGAADTAQLLEQAAEDAAGSGASDLEAVCRTALGALYEKAERLDAALETLQLAVTAERRDRARARRFAQALAELPAPTESSTELLAEPSTASSSEPSHEPAPASTSAAERGPTSAPAQASAPAARTAPRRARRAAEDAERFDEAVASEATTVLPAITRGDRKLARSRWEELLREGRDEQRSGAPDDGGTGTGTPPAWARFERMLNGDAADDADNAAADDAEQGDTAAGWGAVSWNGSTGESPIGDLLIRGLRSGPGGPGGDEAPGRRNGKARDGGGEDAPAPEVRRSRRRDRNGTAEPAGPSGWMPASVDSADERPSRSRRSRAHSRPDDVRRTDAGEARDEAGGAPDDRPGDTADERSARRRTDAGPRGRRRAADPSATEEPDERSVRRTSSEESRGHRPARTAWEGDGGRATARSASERSGARPSARGRHDRTAPSTDGAPPESPEEGTNRSSSRSRSRRGAAADADTGTGGDTGPAGGVLGEVLGDPALGADVPVNGRRHRADDPWATGRWTVTPGVRQAPQPSAADETPVPAPPVPAPSVPAAEPGGWLQAALADLDRVLGSTSVVPRADRDPDPGPGPDPDPGPTGSSPGSILDDGSGADGFDADGCVVVVDIARDGRRFAGRRAGAVVRAVADRLEARLPSGAHQRFGDSDALVIDRPGWGRVAATEWMHRTLPGLLAGFVPEEDLPAAQLRAAVHDADGPVGAQILQDLSRPAGRAPDPWNDLGTRKAEPRGAAHPADRRGGPDAARRGTRSSHTVDRRVRTDDPPGWPWSGEDSGEDSGADIGDTAVDPAAASTGGANGAGPATESGASSDRGAGRHEAGPDEPAGDIADADTDPARSRRADVPNGRARSGAGRRERREAGDAPREGQRAARARRDEPAGREAAPPSPSTTGSRNGEAARVTESAPGERPAVATPARAEATATASGARGGRRNGAAAGDADGAGRADSAGSGATGRNGAGAEEEPGRGAAGSADNLGIADLLAGALAAYRGI
ncbi:hypothetical protein FB558_1436 [Pseudonocardia kunmingensis]|uniref:Syndecan 1 n=1 Tax=Pseudonocardia kunmingensis TaxID=630975 RepID=A0A543DZA0_9PSEU|nr:hypothetical protein FB558_1436 [Pseudonocardia kunmingensis]